MTCAVRYAALSSLLIRQDVLPLSVGYAILMAALVAGLLLVRRAARRAARRDAGAKPGAEQPATEQRQWLRLIRHVGGTMAGGYLLLMLVNIGYYYGVAKVSGNFIASGFTGTAMLVGLSVLVFAPASWLLERRRARTAARNR